MSVYMHVMCIVFSMPLPLAVLLFCFLGFLNISYYLYAICVHFHFPLSIFHILCKIMLLYIVSPLHS